jgi:DNA polymerase-3 subunit alpha
MINGQKEFSNFKIHSQYSICEGAIKIDDLASHCKENKIKSIGLCDSYNLCGALEFAEKISKVGSQPIIGTQINFLLEGFIGKLPLFASSELGYKNLTKLSSKSYLESSEKKDPHCNFEELLNFNQDIILLSGNCFDLFGKLFKFNKLSLIENTLCLLKKTFINRFYIEIQRHNEISEAKFENHLIAVSEKLKIPLIATQEVFYLNKDMFEAHDALICLGEKTFIDVSKRKK